MVGVHGYKKAGLRKRLQPQIPERMEGQGHPETPDQDTSPAALLTVSPVGPAATDVNAHLRTGCMKVCCAKLS